MDEEQVDEKVAELRKRFSKVLPGDVEKENDPVCVGIKEHVEAALELGGALHVGYHLAIELKRLSDECTAVGDMAQGFVLHELAKELSQVMDRGPSMIQSACEVDHIMGMLGLGGDVQWHTKLARRTT